MKLKERLAYTITYSDFNGVAEISTHFFKFFYQSQSKQTLPGFNCVSGNGEKDEPECKFTVPLTEILVRGIRGCFLPKRDNLPEQDANPVP
jgi:hypothetical protein